MQLKRVFPWTLLYLIRILRRSFTWWPSAEMLVDFFPRFRWKPKWKKDVCFPVSLVPAACFLCRDVTKFKVSTWIRVWLHKPTLFLWTQSSEHCLNLVSFFLWEEKKKEKQKCPRKGNILLAHKGPDCDGYDIVSQNPAASLLACAFNGCRLIWFLAREQF